MNNDSEKDSTKTSIAGTLTTPSTQEIVDRYLPGVRWQGLEGLCLCPGHKKHSHQPAKPDCKVFTNGVPTVYCYHNGCKNEIREVNQKIRTAWSLFQPPVDEAVLAEAKAKAAHRYALEERAKASLPQVLKEFAWDIQLYSPAPADEQFYNWKSLFKPEDIIWIGDTEDSGMFYHKKHFRAAGEFKYEDFMTNWSHYSTASTYQPGSYSRANVNLKSTPFMIVEGDQVLGLPVTEADKVKNKLACAAIFRWMSESLKLNLRAVIDSGNKSLHGWFDMPNPETFAELKVVLPAMGCDRALFKPSQPARIPGVERDNGNMQSLIYFS